MDVEMKKRELDENIFDYQSLLNAVAYFGWFMGGGVSNIYWTSQTTFLEF